VVALAGQARGRDVNRRPKTFSAIYPRLYHDVKLIDLRIAAETVSDPAGARRDPHDLAGESGQIRVSEPGKCKIAGIWRSSGTLSRCS
jgi:hypothetical protein